ncbi:cyclic nucleotide-binding domain-containing protein [Streptomyces sp. NPDC059209]|uniref:cyclic nucleotide-binding domain-containing protein n=1 Tax=Streptomyces sp. NPDC059209 TaxID=3346769 RepID=UPI00368A031F
MSGPSPLLLSLPAAHRERLLGLAHARTFPAGHRLFEEEGDADRFWLIRQGEIALDLHAPGKRTPVIETLGPGQQVGWSWIFPPYRWHLGARALDAVDTWEFDAAKVRELCAMETEFGYELMRCCAAVIADRLQATRIRLLDLYAPRPDGPA